MLNRQTLAVVFGGSGSIGCAIARALYLTGATVIISGRSIERLSKAASAIESSAQAASGCTGSVVPIACDITDSDSVTGFFVELERQHGLCSLLINSAGVMKGGATESLDAEALRLSLEVNVVGPALCAREAFKHMKRRPEGPGGRIINVGSISAFSPRPDSLPYTSSKFALQGLTRSLALDGRQYGIAVGAVHAGNVYSELLTKEQIAQREQTEGFITAEDVAQTVLTMSQLPLTANVLELTVIPTGQPLVGRG